MTGGPFAGMRYGPYASDKGLLSRLAGTYEKETYPAVDRIIAMDPDTVVVAGSGEGYFSVGLARRLPGANVIAYELSRWGRYLTRHHAERNGVQVDIRGFCTPSELSAALQGSARPAVICDIEGGEREVLDLEAVPALKQAIILAELHPMFVDGIEELIARRFEATHSIEVMRLGERTVDDIPAKMRNTIPDDEALWAIDEMKIRGGSGAWMLLVPKP